jgi:NAD+ kinase
MTLGIIANTTKDNALEIVASLIQKFEKNGLNFLLSSSLSKDKKGLISSINKNKFIPDEDLAEACDIIISIGGDGTMLATAYLAQLHDKPVLGLNLGKLGFLAEVNIYQTDLLIDELKNNNFTIEERMIITGECKSHKLEKLFAINDIVIDKGGWPKMIEITIEVDGELVTTFSADGLIAATPTGSTGYSISCGGPIVSPKTNVITLTPISPHSLTVRPLVLPGDQEIILRAESLHKKVQVSCDGQRVFGFNPPLEIKITKNDRSLKLVHTSISSYFETLRNKLLWGIDLRKHFLHKEKLK